MYTTTVFTQTALSGFTIQVSIFRCTQLSTFCSLMPPPHSPWCICCLYTIFFPLWSHYTPSRKKNIYTYSDEKPQKCMCIHVYVHCFNLSFQAWEDLLKFDTTAGTIVVIEVSSVKGWEISKVPTQQLLIHTIVARPSSPYLVNTKRAWGLHLAGFVYHVMSTWLQSTPISAWRQVGRILWHTLCMP